MRRRRATCPYSWPSVMNSCSAAISGRRWRSGWARLLSASPAPSGSMRWRRPASSSPTGRCSRSAAHIVGTRHAVLGVLLMVGIAAFTVPSPDFGPAVLAAPLWALALLHYWRALGERQRGAWFLLGARSRPAAARELCRADPARADDRVHARDLRRPSCAAQSRAMAWRRAASHRRLPARGVAQRRARTGAGRHRRQRGRCRPVLARHMADCALLATHLGLALLGALASGWPRGRHERAPEINRNPVEPFARLYVYFFALAPAVCAIAIAYASAQLGPLRRITPLVVLSGLAVVLAAGDQVLLYRERMVSSTWLGLLVAPPVLVVLGLAVLPWTLGTDVKIAQPTNTEGQLLRRYVPAPHRQTARVRHGRRAHRAAGCARRAEPAACLFRLGAAAQPMGHRGGGRRAGRRAGLAGRRQCRHGAAGAEDAVPRNGAGSAARVRALGARPIALDPGRLVDVAAAGDALALSRRAARTIGLRGRGTDGEAGGHGQAAKAR